MSELPQSVGDFIRARLADLGWSHADLARVLGVRQSAVTQRLGGKLRMSSTDAVRFGDALGVEPRLLLRMQAEYELSEVRPDASVKRRAVALAKERAERALTIARACAEIGEPEREAAE